MSSNTNDAEMLNPLTAASGGDDFASQTSSQRSASLLERIRAQQQQQQLQRAVSEHGTSSTNTPQQIQVPRYNPVPQQQPQQQDMNMDGSGGSNLFTSAWGSMSWAPNGMEQGMTSHDSTTMDAAQDALLAPATTTSAAERAAMADEYSMSGYFLTFVRDIYELFQSLPVWARWVVCLVLLYIALKLL